MMKTKFELKDMLTIGLTFVVTVIGLSYGISVISDTGSTFCSGNYDDGACVSCASSEPTYNTSTNLCYNSTGQTTSPLDASTSEFNATHSGLLAVSKLPEKMPLIATVVIAAIIIGILVRYLYVRFN
ncbi:MAG: hypothetical protein KKC77_19265 [Proteobacteria bacterium]|nr:hypothetical protein [Pseudomonadota bacterium]